MQIRQGLFGLGLQTPGYQRVFFFPGSLQMDASTAASCSLFALVAAGGGPWSAPCCWGGGVTIFSAGAPCSSCRHGCTLLGDPLEPAQSPGGESGW
jgi:hypothetical protein